VSTVSARGAALRDVFFATPRNDAVATVSGGDYDRRLVNELNALCADVNVLAVTAVAELDGSVDEGEERMIAADAYVPSGIELRSALSDDDVPGDDALAAKSLDPQPLRV
jgi:hypothetical protein